MKTRFFILPAITLIPGTLMAQTLIDSSSFFTPNLRVQPAGANGIITMTISDDLVTDSASNANNSWTHSAGGHAQVGAAPLGIKIADAQLNAYTQTVNNTLVFGRQITTSGALGSLQGLLNDVAGASVTYTWESDVTVGLAIAPNQLYQVDFTVTSGTGLPLDVLAESNFGITTPGITGVGNESTTSIDILGIAPVGEGSSIGAFSFVFKSDQVRDALNFSFNATSGIGIDGLGGTDSNQNVLTFSGFQVTAIPEPDSLLISGILVGVIIFRRKRNF